MSWQSAARGGLRTLHRGSLPRRTGVIDLQNQLSRVCLAANSGLARPQIQPISSPQSPFQSNSFATASIAPKASKTPKAKSSKNAHNESKKNKKPMSEKQQEAQRLKKLRAQITELKATALLEPPKRLVVSAFGLAMAEKLREIKGQYKIQEAFILAIEHGKSLSGLERERFQSQADANKVANTAAHDAWIRSHTPLQIKEANSARSNLSRLSNKSYPSLKDDRLPKSPKSAYMFYVIDRLGAENYHGKPGTETFKYIGEEWAQLPQSEKDRYEQLHVEDRQRYEREHLKAYGVPAQAVRITAGKSEDSI
ncbi:hypothetical protein PENVUL_c016G06968 [Penicillium vulpinum]|uniref:HMG box domain-containing protein n=1 Tax=Penicillium vulpinum TaxID=29845 RepID=A0A1V6RYR2_9EURO|nr:hypothetical protein PENVUL_c016G06968 [Penicillium vulpinum]